MRGVVEQVAPAVVTIRSERRVRNISQELPEGLREFFGDQFGRAGAAGRCPSGVKAVSGSGVIVRPDGYILTNHHVVDGAEQVNVELTDGRSFKAKVVGSDQPSDLAVLKIDGTNLPTLPLGDSDAGARRRRRARGRQPARRRPDRDDGHRQRQGPRDAAWATAASRTSSRPMRPINQGNSGGALVNTRGELVGINSQILSPSGGNIGIGFAIPANMAHNVMTQLIEHGQVQRGKLGVTIQPVTREIARSLGLDARARRAGELGRAGQPGRQGRGASAAT